jgi:hypothetical protein
MKRHYLLLLSALLSQTTPVWAIGEDDFPTKGTQHRPGSTPGQTPRTNSREYSFELIGDTIRPVSGAQARFRIAPLSGGSSREAELMLSNVRHLRFEAEMRADLVLHPNLALPQDLGRVRERIGCEFEYNGLQSCEASILTPYPLRGTWEFQEDRDRHLDVCTLGLRTEDERQVLHDVYHENTVHEIGHTHIRDIGGERQRERYYDGDTAYLGRIKPQIWKTQNWKNRPGQEYKSENGSRDQDLSNHEGNAIIHVEPFALDNDPRADYRGAYGGPARDLANDEMLAGREAGRLIYSDGKDVFLPHLTQERWERDQARVGFFIASYNKQNSRLQFRDKARFHNNFEQGLYQLASVEEKNGRLEKWIRLGDNPHSVEISVEGGEASIPGIGSLAPREVPPTNAAPQIVNLQADMGRSAARMQEISQYIAAHPRAEGLDVIIGPVGSGKSILAHLLAQRPLEARSVPFRGIRLDTDNRLPGFVIGHQGQAGTTFPAVWYDDAHNRFIADCPGFGDPEGAEKDILNAFSIHRLLTKRGNVKVVVAIKEEDIIGRSTHFIKLLNDITGFFENDEGLRKNLSFVVTHQRRTQPHEFAPLLTNVLGSIQGINTRSRALLEFLAAHPNRISSIPEAEHEGPFDSNAQASQTAIEDSRYINPVVRMQVGTDAKLLIGEFGQSLNNYLTNYMRTEGAQRIINFCRGQIDTHNTTVGDLRTGFTDVVRKLRKLQQVSADTPMKFAKRLSKFMSVEDIERTIGHISFLRNIKDNVAYQISDWVNALLPTIKKIDSLTTPPTVEEQNGELYLKAAFLGASEIQEAIISNPNHPVHAYAWNTIFFDTDITNHGKSFVAIAPEWKFLKEITIDLRGVKGPDGARGRPGINAVGGDGQPGGPGQNGGNFYGRVSFPSQEDLKHLNVNTSGGPGGKGGNGGAGVNGADGVDGDLDHVSKQESWAEHYTPNGNYHQHNTGTRNFYEHQGTNGATGQDGGRGGQGGFGGNQGMTHLDGLQDPHLVATQGTVGANGTPGEGGQGGLNGQHCTGKVIVNIRHSHWHNNNRHPRADYAEADRVEIARAHKGPRGSAPNGNPPQAAQGFNAADQQPPATQSPLDRDLIVQDFAKTYQNAAADSLTAPFVKTFPGLPNEK